MTNLIQVKRYRGKNTNKSGGVTLRKTCMVCGHPLKRRRYRRVGIGPTCSKKLRNGYAGIQLRAFEPLPELVNGV